MTSGWVDRALAPGSVALETGHVLRVDPETLAAGNRLTAGGAAQRIQEMLAVGNGDFALRLVSVALETIRTMSPEQAGEYLADPVRIDDPRWDTLLRTAIRWQLTECGYRAPKWTECTPLARPMFLYDTADLTPAWRERIVERTPESFARVNIWCDPGRDFSTA